MREAPNKVARAAMDFINMAVRLASHGGSEKREMRCVRQNVDDLEARKSPVHHGGGPGFWKLDYLVACTGAGAGAGALGQQEAARTEAAAAMTRNLTVFM